MTIFLFLVIGLVFACVFAFWKNRFEAEKNIGEMSSNSTALAPIRTTTWSTTAFAPESKTSPTWLPRGTTDRLSVNSLSQDILNNCPYSISTQKRILVNLRIVEYKLVELEHFLIIKGLDGSLGNRKFTT
ncbi:PREDICTED: kita-kyushu lung cancer antigen 1 [Chinchilla lanigera]|uniref:Uncharacterized protein n=1 Tax=Chinchilla lanigera TaxID=34839 RepID=A0A8C2UZ02_CHILA|nr:PREDICTED: kita-kyushu lung cancer antigen 1 [Chinchilla lanigera]